VVITTGSFAPTLIPKLFTSQNVLSFNVLCKNNGAELAKVQKLKETYPRVEFINDEFEDFFEMAKDSLSRAMAS